MSAHRPGCPRAVWLLEQPKRGLLWRILALEGPVCECAHQGDCSAAEQSPARDG